jgi:DNA-binding transcriptional LysR family regulator
MMHTPSFAEANAFIAVVEHNNFRKAATQLGLSPPRVSEMLRNLEERLGVRLVERTTRSVSPTPAGERLLHRLRPALDEYKAALESTDAFRSTPAGTLRLTVGPTAADFVLSPALPRFLALYPEISLDICVDSGLVDIVAARFDAGTRAGEHLDRDMLAVRLTDAWPLVIVAAPEYLARHGRPKTPQDLKAHNCIRVRLPSGALFPWRLSVKRRACEVHAEGRLILNEFTMVRKAALQGVGLVQIGAAYVADDVSAGRLERVLDEWAPPPIDGFFLYYPSRRQMRPPLKALIDFFRNARDAGGRIQPLQNL